MKQREKDNQNRLKQNKPLVYDKVIKFDMPRIQLQWDYRCSMKCQHCSIDNVKDKSRKRMTIEDAKNLFKEADSIGISRVTITGGEPSIFPDLEDLIEAIDPTKFWIQMDSNCSHLDENKIIHLKNTGVDCIAPSLDSLDKKSHDDFRRSPGSADKVLEVIDLSKKHDMNIYIQTVVTKSRLYSDEFLNFIEYFTDKDIGVFVSFAKPVGAYSGCFDDLIDRSDLPYIEHLEKKYKVFTHLTPAYNRNLERMCVASRNIFGVTAYGDVLPCIYFYCSMGNILEESLEDILKKCISLKPFKTKTCPLADKSEGFIEKYLVKKIYGKKLPVHHSEVFEDEDYD